MVFIKVGGVSLIESLIVVSILMMLALFAVPSFVEWRTLTDYNNLMTRIASLAKFGRALAISERTAVTLVIEPGTSGCLGLTSGTDCQCNMTNSCTLFGLEKRVLVSPSKATISTSTGEKVTVTFDGTHGMSFSQALTVNVTRAEYSGKLIVSNLGRVRFCSDEPTMRLPLC